jgi:hypothetical protein
VGQWVKICLKKTTTTNKWRAALARASTVDEPEDIEERMPFSLLTLTYMTDAFSDTSLYLPSLQLLVSGVQKDLKIDYLSTSARSVKTKI